MLGSDTIWFYTISSATTFILTSQYDTSLFKYKNTGIGVIFDTFRNTENPHSHRDVTVLINDGEKTWAMMTAEVQVRVWCGVVWCDVVWCGVQVYVRAFLTFVLLFCSPSILLILPSLPPTLSPSLPFSYPPTLILIPPFLLPSLSPSLYFLSFHHTTFLP